jgi:hypothetical protein
MHQNEKYSELFIEIAQRAKKLLRSWQGLLNTSSTDSSSISPTNGDTKPRLILKVKFNSPVTKRKRESDLHTNNKRKKGQVIQTPIVFTETNSSLPRLKTTQQLLMEMQMNEPSVLSSQTSTINAILQKKIISETLNETIKLDYSALHHGREKRPSSTLISSNTNWENGSSAGSPVSPLSSSSSSSIASTTSWPLSTIIPEPSLTISVIPQHDEQSTKFSSDLATICASFNTVADLVEDHRRRMLIEHDSRELEARPDLLLVPIDQLAFVYERERTKELNLPLKSKHSSMTLVEKLNPSSDLIALPFIDCPFEFNLTLDELVVQHPTTDM